MLLCWTRRLCSRNCLFVACPLPLHTGHSNVEWLGLGDVRHIVKTPSPPHAWQANAHNNSFAIIFLILYLVDNNRSSHSVMMVPSLLASHRRPPCGSSRCFPHLKCTRRPLAYRELSLPMLPCGSPSILRTASVWSFSGSTTCHNRCSPVPQTVLFPYANAWNRRQAGVGWRTYVA